MLVTLVRRSALPIGSVRANLVAVIFQPFAGSMVNPNATRKSGLEMVHLADPAQCVSRKNEKAGYGRPGVRAQPRHFLITMGEITPRSKNPPRNLHRLGISADRSVNR